MIFSKSMPIFYRNFKRTDNRCFLEGIRVEIPTFDSDYVEGGCYDLQIGAVEGHAWESGERWRYTSYGLLITEDNVVLQ